MTSGKMQKNRIIRDTFPYISNMSKGEVINRIKKIMKSVESESHDNDFPFAWIDVELLDEIELSVLRLYLLLCASHEETYCSLNTDEMVNDVFDDYPVSVNYIDEYKALIIDTPVSFASYRTVKGKVSEHLLSHLVSVGIKKYLADNEGKVRFDKDKEYDVLIFRRVRKNMGSSAVCDADNIEIRNLINELVKVLGFTSDSYSHLVGIESKIEYVENKEDSGTTFVVVNDEFKLDMELRYRNLDRSLDFLRQQY